MLRVTSRVFLGSVELQARCVCFPLNSFKVLLLTSSRLTTCDSIEASLNIQNLLNPENDTTTPPLIAQISAIHASPILNTRQHILINRQTTLRTLHEYGPATILEYPETSSVGPIGHLFGSLDHDNWPQNLPVGSTIQHVRLQGIHKKHKVSYPDIIKVKEVKSALEQI